MFKVFLTAFILCFSAAAFAVDPECVDPEAYVEDIHGQYDATSQVRFCTPTLDVLAYPLGDEDLTSCTVTLAGQPFALTSTNRPGAYVAFDVPDSVKQSARVGSIEVFCTSEEDGVTVEGDKAIAMNARFRDRAAPGAPTLLR